MTDRPTQIFSGLPITSLGTLASRVLGMLRDMSTAALLGVSGDGVMDAFVVAFRIPNLFRRLFGEGALTASYLPVLAQELERGQKQAWHLASATLVWLGVVLAALTVVGEGVCGVLWWLHGDSPAAGRVIGLSAVLLPYLWFICISAQLAATLQAFWSFAPAAIAPALLNVCWLAGAWLVAPWFAPDREAQAYVLAVSILVAGVLQVGVQWPVLRRLGFRFEYDWPAARAAVMRVLHSLVPMMTGLAVTQINTFLDSLMAWGLTAPTSGDRAIPWLGGLLDYPFEQGAASAIYFAERLYQFPLGILGMAVATVIFPALSRHAARGMHRELGEDLTTGLRLVFFLGLPAGAGLLLLAQPLAELFFEHGAVTPEDTARVAHVIACYAFGVWAFCASPVMVRGYYAMGNQITPLRIALATVAVNLVLNLCLIWPLGEAGLALSTSLAAAFQLVALAAAFDRTASRLIWPELGRTIAHTALATTVMVVVGYFVLRQLPADSGSLLRVFVPLSVSGLVFLAIGRLIRSPELGLLKPRSS